MTKPTLIPETSFADRLIAVMREQFPGGLRSEGVGVHRRVATRVLLGINQRFIPVRFCERRPFIEIGDLSLLVCCLDDHEVGAIPGSVTADQLILAWTAAGHRPWLEREFRRQAMRQFNAAGVMDDLGYWLKRAFRQ